MTIVTGTVKQTHPFRGVLWGLVFGIGLTFVLVITTIISLDLVTMLVVTLVATAIGVAWSIYGPARAPKAPPPGTQVRMEPSPATRFDDDAYASPAAAGAHPTATADDSTPDAPPRPDDRAD